MRLTFVMVLTPCHSAIGELLQFKSKYGPGGEFDPGWYVFIDPLRCVMLTFHQETRDDLCSY